MIIFSKNFPEIRLRSIESHDIEFLRVIKNSNKSAFFHSSNITVEEQSLWFREFLQRENDFMFIFEERNSEIFESRGSIGFRIINQEIDIYNVIRAHKSIRSTSKMKYVMQILLNYINKHYKFDTTCKVLNDNTALNWYTDMGVKVLNSEINSTKLIFDYSTLEFLDINLKGEI